MNIQGLIGKKLDQAQGFLEDGTRVPISYLWVSANMVTQVKGDKEGYHALQIGFDSIKRTTKALQGHIKKAGIEKLPRFFREIRLEEKADEALLGSELKAEEVFQKGDIIDVTGISKGKGFAGGVKLHHFKGGPRTHGQSDRERAPGSIGQSTTPGRVYKGKRMAGRKGNKQSTIKNLEVLDIVNNTLLVKGLVPGPKGAIMTIQRKGKNKKFVPLFTEKEEEGKEGKKENASSEAQSSKRKAQS